MVEINISTDINDYDPFHTGDHFLISMAEYSDFRTANPDLKILTERRMRVTASDVSSRVLNLWEHAGILPSGTRDGTGWRSFSLVDLLWIHLIKRMTNFGIQLSAIKNGMEKLSSRNTEDLFHVEHGFAFVRFKTPLKRLYFIATKDGRMQFVDKVSFDQWSNLTFGSTTSDSILLILVNKIVQDLLGDKSPIPADIGLHLSEAQVRILDQLNHPTLKSLKVEKRNCKIDSIEKEEVLEGKSDNEIEKDWKDLRHGEISLKKRDGRTVHATKKTRIKL